MAVVVMVVLGASACGAGETDLTDAQVVYCLADGHVPALVDAAVDLGLAAAVEGEQNEQVVVVGKRTLTPGEWRDAQPDAFERACRAISPAAAAESSGFLLPGLFGTLNVIVGAAIAFGVGRWVERSSRGRQQARALRATAAAFVVAASAYARDLEDRTRAERPSDSTVRERRADLMTELRAIEAEYPRSTARRILATLSTELSADSLRGWRVTVPADIAGQLDALQTEAVTLARALEHRRRERNLLHGSVPETEGAVP
jgi:hypothetical protein